MKTATHLKFEGLKNPELRAYIESLPETPIDPLAEPFKAYAKTQLTYAAKVSVPFSVRTIEGVMDAKAGDYLAVGAHGEMYPIDAAVFEASYVEA